MTSPSTRFELLLPLRGVLALSIVLHHCARIDLGLYQGRVVLFFLISGFCIFDSAESAVGKSRTTLSWLTRRVVRIWPTYLLALLYVVAIVALRPERRPGLHVNQSLGGWISNALLLDWARIFPGPIASASRNPHLVVPAHWTLGYEIQFYALVALALAVRAAGRAVLPWLAAALGLLGLGVNLLSPSADHGIILDYSAHIALGAAVYYRGVLHASASPRRFLLDAAIVGTLLLAIAATGLIPSVPGAIHYAPAELVVSATAALALVALRRWDAPVARSKAFLPLRALGVISYSIFLVHSVNLPVARELARLVLPADPARWVFLSVVVAFHVALAIPFWFICERPFANRRVGRDRTATARPPVPAPVSAMLPA